MSNFWPLPLPLFVLRRINRRVRAVVMFVDQRVRGAFFAVGVFFSGVLWRACACGCGRDMNTKVLWLRLRGAPAFA